MVFPRSYHGTTRTSHLLSLSSLRAHFDTLIGMNPILWTLRKWLRPWQVLVWCTPKRIWTTSTMSWCEIMAQLPLRLSSISWWASSPWYSNSVSICGQGWYHGGSDLTRTVTRGFPRNCEWQSMRPFFAIHAYLNELIAHRDGARSPDCKAPCTCNRIPA